MKTIELKLTEDTYQSIKRVAEQNGRTIEEQIEMIVIYSPWPREVGE